MWARRSIRTAGTSWCEPSVLTSARLAKSGARCIGALSRAPKIAGLVTPVRLPFQLYPPESGETNDVAHNARFLDVANRNDSVTKFKLRLRFHGAASETAINSFLREEVPCVAVGLVTEIEKAAMRPPRLPRSDQDTSPGSLTPSTSPRPRVRGCGRKASRDI
jgi:hypothetical protein